jgi:hypothetical protein
VAARDQQGNERERRRIGRQEWRQQVPFEMVDAHQRPFQRGGQRGRDAGTDEQGAGQSRAARVGHDVDVAPTAISVAQDLAQQRDGTTDVIARSEFGHDTAEGRVHVGLAVQRVREQCRRRSTVDAHQRHTGFVTGGLEAEDFHRRSGRWQKSGVKFSTSIAIRNIFMQQETLAAALSPWSVANGECTLAP